VITWSGRTNGRRQPHPQRPNAQDPCSARSFTRNRTHCISAPPCGRRLTPQRARMPGDTAVDGTRRWGDLVALTKSPLRAEGSFSHALNGFVDCG
jgi:hypothetical protein